MRYWAGSCNGAMYILNLSVLPARRRAPGCRDWRRSVDARARRWLEDNDYAEQVVFHGTTFGDGRLKLFVRLRVQTDCAATASPAARYATPDHSPR